MNERSAAALFDVVGTLVGTSCLHAVTYQDAADLADHLRHSLLAAPQDR